MKLVLTAVLCAACVASPAAAATRLVESWTGACGVGVSATSGLTLISVLGPAGGVRARPASPAAFDALPSDLSTGPGSGGGAGAPAARTALLGCSPNPFNPATSIRYTLAGRVRVRLRIYGVRGELVRTLVDRVEEPGNDHAAFWDGSTDAGGPAPSGLYFCTLEAPDLRGARKLILVR